MSFSTSTSSAVPVISKPITFAELQTVLARNISDSKFLEKEWSALKSCPKEKAFQNLYMSKDFVMPKEEAQRMVDTFFRDFHKYQFALQQQVLNSEREIDASRFSSFAQPQSEENKQDALSDLGHNRYSYRSTDIGRDPDLICEYDRWHPQESNTSTNQPSSSFSNVTNTIVGVAIAAIAIIAAVYISQK